MKVARSLVILVFVGVSTGFCQQNGILEKDQLERPINRKAVPAEHLAAAVTAVQAIGDQTLRGQFNEVVEKMYPRYRNRAAKKLGGKAEMAAQMKKLVNDYAASGISITGFVAEPATIGFDIPEFNEWLVFVPTTRTVSFIDPKTGRKETRNVSDYQVAVRGKGEGETWSFLNGSTLKVKELRSLFPSLPADIGEWAIPQKSVK